ncbi:MAG: WYL domain-containing protein [Candidatus Melainabacteria bacterium]|nr:WYL domain-containing protein [Candidatus Melainabacteria bacterium]
MSRLDRLVAMEDEIRRGRYPTVEKFCDMFEVKPRTVYADIRELKERVGLEIAFDRFKNGYYSKNPQKQLPKFELTDGEVFALTLGKEMLSQYTGTVFEPILRSALEKIYDRLPDRVRVDIDDLRCMIKFNAGSVIQVSRKLMLDFYHACEQNFSVDIRYFTAHRGEVTERRIDPYRLLENRGTWYVVAYCHWRKDVRLFALHRIQYHAISNEHFELGRDSEIEDFLSSAFFLEHTEQEYRVTIKFAPHSARYIRERVWHQSQELHEHDDGSCTLSFNAPSLDEVKRWVLMYGSDAEVLEPQFFRELIASDLAQAAKRYSTK